MDTISFFLPCAFHTYSKQHSEVNDTAFDACDQQISGQAISEVHKARYWHLF